MVILTPLSVAVATDKHLLWMDAGPLSGLFNILHALQRSL